MQLVLLKKKYTMKHCIRWLMNMINIFVLFLSHMMINPVLAANDDEYLEITDIWTIQAYKYWSDYGLTSDSSYSYTDTYSTSGSLTYGASVTMSGSSSGSASGSTSGSFQIASESSSVPYSVWIPKSVDLSLTPDSGQTGSQSYPSFACVYNANSTSTNAVMTCTANGNSVFTQDDYTLEINTIGDAGDGTGGLFCYLKPSSTQSSVGTITASSDAPFHSQFTLSQSSIDNGSFSGSGTISLTTSTVNTNTLKFAYPIMAGNISTDTRRKSNDARQLFNRPNNPATVIFLINENWSDSAAGSFDIYECQNNTKVANKTVIRNMTRTGTGYKLFCVSVYSDDIGDADITWNQRNSFIIRWKYPNNVHIIPIFVGYSSDIPDDLYRYIYHGDRTLDELQSFHSDMVTGTSGSQFAASDLSNQQQSFEGATNNLVNLESDTFDGVSDAIGNVQVDNNILIGSGFLNAANWVRVQFDNLTSYPAFNSVLVFSLSLGFALLIIGKVR